MALEYIQKNRLIHLMRKRLMILQKKKQKYFRYANLVQKETMWLNQK